MEKEEEPLKPSVCAPPGAPKKKHVNMIFIGHADAGKSTNYRTSNASDWNGWQKDTRNMEEKLKRKTETWYLYWGLDTNQEELDKGKTVEGGQDYFKQRSSISQC